LARRRSSPPNSCYLTEDEELAKKFLEVAQKFNGKGHLYKAVQMK
jgi:hypothetical protein